MIKLSPWPVSLMMLFHSSAQLRHSLRPQPPSPQIERPANLDRSTLFAPGKPGIAMRNREDT
jgi:hypothetical protein